MMAGKAGTQTFLIVCQHTLRSGCWVDELIHWSADDGWLSFARLVSNCLVFGGLLNQRKGGGPSM